MCINAPIICDSLFRISLSLIDEKNVFRNATDSLEYVVANIETARDSLHRVVNTVSYNIIPDNLVTIEALRDSQKFYADSFSNILWLVGTIIVIGCAIFGFLGTLNWRQAKKYSEETKKDVDRINNELENNKKAFENRISDLENELKKQIDNQKKKFESNIENQNEEFRQKILGLENSLKEQIEKQNKDFKLSKDSLCRDIANCCLISLNAIYENNEMKLNPKDFFNKVGGFFSVYYTHKVDLNENDIGIFRGLNAKAQDFLKNTNSLIETETFPYYLYNIVEYCKEMKKELHLKILNKTWEIICNKFGKENVMECVEYYNKQFINLLKDSL